MLELSCDCFFTEKRLKTCRSVGEGFVTLHADTTSDLLQLGIKLSPNIAKLSLEEQEKFLALLSS